MVPTLDQSLLFLLNGIIGSDPALFTLALQVSDRLPWLICACVLVVLWFRGETDQPETASALTRQESRQRVLLIFLAMLLAFLAVRPLAAALHRARPMVAESLLVPIDAQVWANVVDAVRNTSPFPSDQAALWFALVAGLFIYRKRTGVIVGAIILVLCLVRIGLGYVYPSDILAGASVGVLTLTGVFVVRNWLTWITRPTAMLFEGLPAIAYPFGLLVLLDITQHMAGIIGLLAVLFNTRL
jgi:undecaprenyl-diphosphatase